MMWRVEKNNKWNASDDNSKEMMNYDTINIDWVISVFWLFIRQIKG